MELEVSRFLKSYRLDDVLTEHDLIERLTDITTDQTPMDNADFEKNILALRILSLTNSKVYMKRYPEHCNLDFSDVFIKKKLIKMMSLLTNELEIRVPELVMQIVPAIVSVSTILIWIVIVAGFLYQNTDLLFLGLEIIVIPSIVIIVAAPAVLLRFIFQDFFAPHLIDRVNSFKEFVDLVYSMNSEKYGKENNHTVMIKLLAPLIPTRPLK